jgi:uncharacterized protein (UPF0303 family)
MTLEHDIERLALQEERLRFAQFDKAMAWQLGCQLKAQAEASNVPLLIEIWLGGEAVFIHSMDGTTPMNADWARRKRNTVELMQRSSYAVGRANLLKDQTLKATLGLPTRDYADHGGCFPIRVNAVGGCVGTVTVSGAPQRDDHNLVVEVLAKLCGVPLAEVALS